jgi:hypothetical protein
VSSAALAGILTTARACRTVFFDTTLVGRSDPIDTFLRDGVPSHVDRVLRVCSGLKLFQQGMELANCRLAEGERELESRVNGPASGVPLTPRWRVVS